MTELSEAGAADPRPVAAAGDRRRVVTWEDPGVGAALALELNGLDYLRGIADGCIPAPPIATLLGLGIAEVEPGRVTFSLDVGEHLYNPIGSVHGGVFCTLLDSAMACAVHSTLGPGQAYTTLELKVNLVKPLTVHTPRVVATGQLLSAGRRVATASGQITGPDGTLYAHATTTCLIIDTRQGGGSGLPRQGGGSGLPRQGGGSGLPRQGGGNGHSSEGNGDGR